MSNHEAFDDTLPGIVKLLPQPLSS